MTKEDAFSAERLEHAPYTYCVARTFGNPVRLLTEEPADWQRWALAESQ